MTRRLLIGLVLTAGSLDAATAAMAPQFERARQLSAAMDRLQEVASVMPDPIETITYVRGEVRFMAGACYVAVTIRFKGSSTPGTGGGDRYVTEVGPRQCR